MSISKGIFTRSSYIYIYCTKYRCFLTSYCLNLKLFMLSVAKSLQQQYCEYAAKCPNGRGYWLQYFTSVSTNISTMNVWE